MTDDTLDPGLLAAERRRTQEHIDKVRAALADVMGNVRQRALAHDASKLQEPELSAFAASRGKPEDFGYGTPGYDAMLREVLDTALAHHYAHNRHHPQHWPNGIRDMSLLDLIEMLADWYAAGKRTVGGSMERSFSVNKDRFTISPELMTILRTTARELGWE